MRLLVETVEKLIIEKEVAKYDSTKVLSMCATKVIMIYLTTMDGSAAIPLIHYPTDTVSGEFMKNKVKMNNYRLTKLIFTLDL